MNKSPKPGKVQRLLRSVSRAILADICGPYPSRSSSAEQTLLSLSGSLHCSDCPVREICHVLKDTEIRSREPDCTEEVRRWLNDD